MNTNTKFTTGTQRHGYGKFNFIKLCLCASVVIFGLSSCAEMAKDMGLEEVPDVQQRMGLTGTADNPAVINPFQTYDLVMAANECRYFQMKVPANWYWKVFLTAANRDDTRHAQLSAQIAPSNPQWQPLTGTYFSKNFDLAREGVQTVLAVGNNGDTRNALLRLCQQGPPLHITIQSQVSAANDLLGPDNTNNNFPPGQ